MAPIHLVLDPADTFVFERPGEQNVNVELHLKNDSNSCVFFKIKTTAPKRYCVRPNSGKVLPGQNTTVLIILQQVSPADLQKPCKDKFLVQSCTAPESADPKLVWDAVPADQIGEAKLKCSWHLPSLDLPSVPEQPPASASLATTAVKAADEAATPVSAAAGLTDLQAIKKENAELTKRNNELRKELEAHKRAGNQRITDTHGRAAGGGALAMRQSSGPNWQFIILALLIGWYLGHYVI